MSGPTPAGSGAAPLGDAGAAASSRSRGGKLTQTTEDPADEVPDPDEDDLDDLDDMLDEFSAVQIESESAKGLPREHQAPSASSATTGAAKPHSDQGTADDVFSDDEFAKQLQAGMADLLGDIQTTPEIKAHWESMFKELGAAAASCQAGSSVPPGGGPTAKTDESFQETIRKTMQRMQESGNQASAAASAVGSDDFLGELLKQMQAGGLDGEGNEDDISTMLMGMMDQLTHKEILYEPMKELNDKFPDWLQKNKDKTSKDDLQRYKEQHQYVSEMVARFEQPGYADTKTADREYIIDRMQKMQAAGSPPADLVGDMASAQDALNMPECNTQ